MKRTIRPTFSYPAMLGALLTLGSACGGMQGASAPQDEAQLSSGNGHETALTEDDTRDCPPKTANNKGVGAPCSKGGGECRGKAAPYCSVDASKNAPVPFCTKPCFSNSQCGDNATCMPDPQTPILKGCVPNVCIKK